MRSSRMPNWSSSSAAPRRLSQAVERVGEDRRLGRAGLRGQRLKRVAELASAGRAGGGCVLMTVLRSPAAGRRGRSPSLMAWARATVLAACAAGPSRAVGGDIAIVVAEPSRSALLGLDRPVRRCSSASPGWRCCCETAVVVIAPASSAPRSSRASALARHARSSRRRAASGGRR